MHKPSSLHGARLKPYLHASPFLLARCTPAAHPNLLFTQVFPTITSVTPSIGSVVGGTLLTIRGAGFPEIVERPGAQSCNNGGGDGIGGGRLKVGERGDCGASGDTSSLQIMVGAEAVPCDIMCSTFDTARCVTRPAAQDAVPQQRSLGGIYAGLRGIQLDTFNRRCAPRGLLPRCCWPAHVEMPNSCAMRTASSGLWQG